MHKLASYALVICASIAASAQPAFAQQTLNFSLGYFTVRGEDARVEGDVLTANRSLLAFDLSEFNGATVGGEWLVPLGEYFEGGAGLAFSRRTVHSVYQDFVDDDGTEIDQDLRLRIVPIAFTIRVLPRDNRRACSRTSAPASRVCVALQRVGELRFWDDTADYFRDSFVASGSETGPSRSAASVRDRLGECRIRGRYQAPMPSSVPSSRSLPTSAIDLAAGRTCSRWMGLSLIRARASGLTCSAGALALATARRPLVQRYAAALADPRHPAYEMRVVADSLCEDVAAFGFFLHQHPACMRCWSRLEGDLPDHAVPFVDEIGDVEPHVRQLLHVMRERRHAREDLLVAILTCETFRHRAAIEAGGDVQLRLDD